MLRAWPRWALLSLLIGPILVGGHPARALVLDEDWRVNVHWEDPEIVAAFTMRIELDDRRWPFFGTVVSLLKGNIQLYETGTVQWDFSTATFFDGTWSSRTQMSGTMCNRAGNSGTWSAELETGAEVPPSSQ